MGAADGLAGERRAEPNALIVGAAGELGRALARQLSAEGWAVGLSYRSSSGRAEELAAELRSRGGRVWTVQADVSDPDQAAAAVRASPQPLTGVVYAAGPRIRLEYISRIPPEEFSRTIDEDLKGCVNLFTAALPALRQTRGTLLAVSTMAAERYATRDILSALPKAGVEMLVRGIAAEEGRYGVRCNAVAAGPIDSGDGIWQWFLDEGYYDERALEIARGQIPLGVFGRPEDIAHAGAFLMSERAAFVSGQVLHVDGGYSV